MADHIPEDPYLLRPESIEDPPHKLAEIALRIGPGVILASTIVGSGELIATTVLGAENGYTLLWLILVSCVIKVVVQNELGRYTIGTGETTLEAFDRVPGPRLGAGWVVWAWFLSLALALVAVGAMLGGIAEVLNRLVPAVPINAWVWIVNLGTVVILSVGRYELIERVSMIMVAGFTLMTVGAAVVLLESPQYFSWAAVLDGLSFKPPQGGFLTAVAVMGITGVGASELGIYPYWCLEKGYARFTGPRDDTPAWKRRALGWIRVLGIDVVNSMVIYTFATVAFYLLGAGILHGMGVIPVGTEMVDTLSNMYTETLGGWSRYLFLIGAVAVLYSTVFAGTAARSRMLADWLGILRGYDKSDYGLRLRYQRLFVVALLIVPSLYYMFFQEPVRMVKIAGAVEAMMLPIIGFSTVYLRYRHLPRAIAPKGWLTLALWVTTAIMAVMMAYSAIQRLTL
jgi:Mn2+/Fe2+ NRAMP family transporter